MALTSVMDRMIREVIEIHPNSMIREDALHLSQSRKPLIHFLRGQRKPLFL
jgi:hypothetical protein